MVWIKLCFVALVLVVSQSEAVRFKNCGRGLPVRISQFNIRPNPIVIRRGSKITFSGTLRSSRKVGSSYTLKLTVKKKLFIVSVPVPCLGKFGSCTFKGLKCEKMLPYLNVPSCPPPRGTYTLKERTVVIPQVNLPSFLTSGNYFMKAELFDEYTRRMIGCVQVDFTAKS